MEYTLPNLEERFLPPQNWQSDSFFNSETNHKIHYYSVSCETTSLKGCVVILPGLSEFGEKYIETAKFFTERSYNTYIIDWAYQGHSIRLKENPHKRHSDGYETDISDLHYLISNIIKTDDPLYMLAHSMGGNIGLRYLLNYTEMFDAASLSAPMFGILDLKHREGLVKSILSLLKKKYTSYIPGGKDWNEEARSSDGKDIFSYDPIRDQIHNAWCLADPRLQVGNPTLGWVYESLKSIDILKTPQKLQKVIIPILLAYASDEKIIDNKSIKKLAGRLPNSHLLELQNARHEILMETDAVRNKFLNKTLEIFNQ